MVEDNLTTRLRVTGEEMMVVVVADFHQIEWMIGEIIAVTKEGGCFFTESYFEYVEL